MSNNILVVGGGAAGCIAAAAAAENGCKVTLIEANERIGRKVMITGKGRCNLTNYQTDVRGLIDNCPVNGRFLYGAFSKFMPQDVMDLFESYGVPLKVTRGNRVFPVSDKSVDIVDAMDRMLKKNHVRRKHGRAVHLIITDGAVTGVQLESGESLKGDAVILCTGGLSYPRTGSNGDGYKLAEEAGHSVTALTPSLIPLVSNDPDCSAMMGLSLKNVGVTLISSGSSKPVYEDFGELLFTHFGVSGPTVLSASSHIPEFGKDKYKLIIDWKPALDRDKLDQRIQRDFKEKSNKDFQNSLSGLLPLKAVPVFVKKSGIEPTKKVNQISREEREHLVELLKNYSIPLTGFRPIAEATVTSGGIPVKEIDPKTMESRLMPGLYFAGEVIDVDAYTGGYNLQIAFSTGHLAGVSVSEIY